MLNYKIGLHAEVGTFLDRERLAFELLHGARCSKVNGDIGAALDLETERFDDTPAFVGRINSKTRGVGDAQRGFPAVQGFVVLI